MKKIIILALAFISFACVTPPPPPTAKFQKGETVKIKGLETNVVIDGVVCMGSTCGYYVVSSTPYGLSKEYVSEDILEK